MAWVEAKDNKGQLERLEKRIKVKVLLLPNDPNDDRNYMLEIQAGRGGSEANIFTGESVR